MVARLSEGAFGPRGTRLVDLSDPELEAEVARRRRARGASGARSPKGGRAPTGDHDLRRYYANLELSPGASLADVEAAFRRLRAKYDPSRFEGDPARHRTATELLASLRRAFEALRAHLRDEDPR